MEFIGQYSTVKYFQILQKSSYFLPPKQQQLGTLEDSWVIQLWFVKQASNTNPFSQQLDFYINDGRFKWRHDSILKTILFYLTSTNVYDVFADNEGYRSSAELFNLPIRDTVVIKDNALYVIELIACSETNFSKNRNYKINRYKNLSNEVVGNYAVPRNIVTRILYERYESFY